MYSVHTSFSVQSKDTGWREKDVYSLCRGLASPPQYHSGYLFAPSTSGITSATTELPPARSEGGMVQVIHGTSSDRSFNETMFSGTYLVPIGRNGGHYA